MKCAFALIAVVACGSPSKKASIPAPPPSPITGMIAPKAIPGLRWITEHMPWRTPVEVDAIFEVPGDTEHVVLQGRGMWLGVMDLSTGTIATERHVADGRQALQLPDGRLVVFSTPHGHIVGAFLEPATLAITSEHDLGDDDQSWLDAIATPSGELVAALPGQSLNVLDQNTLAVTRELSPDKGIFGLTASLDAVAYTQTDGDRYRTKEVPLRPGGSIPGGRDVLAARGDTVVFGDKHGSSEDYAKKGARVIQFGESVGEGALDATADRYATLREGIVRIRTLTDGSVTSTIDIHDSDAGPYDDHIAFIGNRLVVSFHQQVRVVDIATKTASASPIGPLGIIKQITVDDAGNVETLGHDRVQYAAGKATSSAILEGKLFELDGARAGTYAQFIEDPLTSIKPPDYLRKGWLSWFVDGRKVANKPIDTNVMVDGWTGHDTVVLDGRPGGYNYYDNDAYRYNRDPDPRIWTKWDGNIGWLDIYPVSVPLAIDPDSRTAIVTYPNGPRLVDLNTGKPHADALKRPGCDVAVVMEPGGARIALYDGKALVLVDRATEAVITSIDMEPLEIEKHGVSVQFLRRGDEILLSGDDRIAFWSPATKQLRIARIDGVRAIDTSPDGHQLAIAFTDARVALVDLDALLARLPVEPARPFVVPNLTCPSKQ